MSLITLKDGTIEDFHEDKWFSGGCETCNYGSKYVQNLIITTSREKLRYNLCQMFEYPISQGWLMKLFTGNIDYIKTMTLDEFKKWFDEALEGLKAQSFL